ncbi:hypothetical protein TRVL_03836 [Trypanosoma vivax]|nr:hypothetical protein TRVL_03836 [Trypanosoma vivax]
MSRGRETQKGNKERRTALSLVSSNGRGTVRMFVLGCVGRKSAQVTPGCGGEEKRGRGLFQCANAMETGTKRPTPQPGRGARRAAFWPCVSRAERVMETWKKGSSDRRV